MLDPKDPENKIIYMRRMPLDILRRSLAASSVKPYREYILMSRLRTEQSLVLSPSYTT
jgi:hypothetical protein